MEEKFKPKGRVYMEVRDARTGELIERWEHDNLIVNGGLAAMARLCGSADQTKEVDTIGVGDDGTTAAGTDTALSNPFTRALSGVSYGGTNVVFSYQIGQNDANGLTIREFGLFCNDGTLFSRIVRNPIVKTNQITISGTWTITF